MSETLYIGLSLAQINKLLNGEEVGKRPYDVEASYVDGEIRYNDTIRICVKMLDAKEEELEPKTAFVW